MSADLKIGIEEAGRHARYTFFESARRSTGSTLVATAHTLDDHLETVIFNMVRGTGLAGLAGIPQRRGAIVRPLLDFTRSETRAYCAEHGLWFHDDPANSDLQHSRTRIRTKVVPELEAINGDVRRAVQRLSQLAVEDDELLNGIAASFLEQNERPLNGDLAFLTKDCEVAFARRPFLTSPGPVVSRALRLIVTALGGSLDHAGTKGVLEALQNPKGSWTAEGGSVCAEWDSEALHLRILRPVTPFRFNLTVPGSTDSPEFGWTLDAYTTSPTDFVRGRNSLDVVIDAGKVRGRLYFRTAQEGESVQPLGLSGTKKLSDLFQERELTKAARARLPIVCDFLGPVWIPGVCLVERVKITEHSTEGLRLRLKVLSGPGE